MPRRRTALTLSTGQSFIRVDVVSKTHRPRAGAEIMTGLPDAVGTLDVALKHAGQLLEAYIFITHLQGLRRR